MKMQLVLKAYKTFLNVHKEVLLDYVVSDKGREPDPDKIAVIDELPTPIKAKGIAKLLGHAGWYGEFISNFSKIAVSMTHLLKKDVRFE